MNKDDLYDDKDQFYNLKYTHEQLVDLLSKIEKNEVLSKDQYTQLIEEIGLDNISTFDLNYYNLKNLPYIPVRLGDLYNDVGYDVKARVDEELNTLEEILNHEIARMDSVKAELESLDINDVLEKIKQLQNKAEYIDNSIKESNGIIFSFERIIESINDKSNELTIEFESLKNMQETDELRLDNIHEVLIVHTEDIQKLLEYYSIEKNKLSDVVIDIDRIQESLIELEDYHGIMKNIDLRMSSIEEAFKLLNPDELDLEGISKLSNDIKDLQQKDLEYQAFHETISQQLNDLSSSVSSSLNSIEKNISLLQTSISEINTITAEHASQLTKHENALTLVNSVIEEKSLLIEEKSLLIDKNIADIENLKSKDAELVLDISTLNQSVQALIDEDLEHRQQLEALESQNEEIENSVTNLINFTSNNFNKINDLQAEISTNTELISEINEELEDIQDTINTNAETVSNNLVSINNRLNTAEANISAIDTNLLTLSETLTSHFETNENRIEEVDEHINALNKRVSGSEANILTFQARVTDLEDAAKALATKEELNTIDMQMHINDNGFVVVELLLLGNIISSITIPYNVKFEEQIAKADHARVDYSKTI